MAKKITKENTFHDIFENDQAKKVLESKGLHCFSCPFAQFETIEQGARAHGLDAQDLVSEMNKKNKDKNKTKKKKQKKLK
jgi:hybrid cluster-associated redox disulfide protein